MGALSGSNKPTAMAQDEAKRQRVLDAKQAEELTKQKALAEDAQATSLQSSLEQETNKLKRAYGAKTLLNAGK